MTKGAQRIDAQGFSGWQECRHRDGYDKDCDGSQVCRRIEMADAVEPSAQELGEPGRSRDSDHQAGKNRVRKVAQHDRQDSRRLRAQRHPNADLLSALGNRVGHHSDNSEAARICAIDPKALTARALYSAPSRLE